MNYLTLPINALYKFDIAADSKILVFAGPYLGYGLSASQKVKLDGVEVTIDDTVKFGSGEDDIKAFDFGVNGGIGYQFTNYFIKAQYNLGLANMTNTDEASIKNTNIGVTVGYMF
ncbi:hypothetical protein AGMMS49525_04110 [Bacteroidia bacterium]|nr:hypothetical protein AGMMS49525_04110 [Bacteroidia bacterium]